MVKGEDWRNLLEGEQAWQGGGVIFIVFMYLFKQFLPHLL